MVEYFMNSLPDIISYQLSRVEMESAESLANEKIQDMGLELCITVRNMILKTVSMYLGNIIPAFFM